MQTDNTPPETPNAPQCDIKRPKRLPKTLKSLLPKRVAIKNRAVKRGRPIDAEFAQGVAKLVSKGLTEMEAVMILGDGHISVSQWYNWKAGRKEQYAELLTHVRGARLQHLVSQIEAAAEGDAERGIRQDWRAADRLMAITAPERFAKQAEAAQAPTTVNVRLAPDLVRLVYGEVTDARPVNNPAQIPETVEIRPG